MNDISYIVICVIAAVLILFPSNITTARQSSESNDTGIKNNNKTDSNMEVSKNQAAEVNLRNKTEMISKRGLYLDSNFIPLYNGSGLASFGTPFFWENV